MRRSGGEYSSSSRPVFGSSVSQGGEYSSRAIVLGCPESGPRREGRSTFLKGGEESVQTLEAECLDSLQSSLRTVEQTNRAAQYTAEALNAQAEQLSRIREASSDIDCNLEASGFYLKGISSFWSSITQLFTGLPDRSQKKASSSSSRRSAAVESLKEASSLRSDEIAASTNSSSGAAFSRDGRGALRLRANSVVSHPPHSFFGSEAAVSHDAFEPELEQGLQRLSSLLGELHGRAAAMNVALREQNAELHDIQMQVDGNREKMQKQQKQIKRILRR